MPSSKFPITSENCAPSSKKKTALLSLITALILGFILVQQGAGLMVILVTLPVLLWLPCSVYVVYKFPDKRRLELQRIAIWISMIAIVLIVHVIRHQTARNNAEEIVTAVRNYWAAHGHCPATMKDIGYDRAQFSAKLGWSYYGCDDGKPSLFYRSTFSFDIYHYDFQHNTWQYTPD